MRALIVGLGRMGQRYEAALRKLYGDTLDLYTVDPQAQPGSQAVHSASLEQIPDTISFDLAVDARPNLGRLELFKQWTEQNIPKLIVEKPMAASMSEAEGFLDHLESLDTRPEVLVPFYRRFMPEFSKQLQSESKLGPLKSIMFGGGACGIGCNGIHLIDLSNFMFGGVPESVFADLVLDSIESPRGTFFKDFGGTVYLRYPNGRVTLEVLPDSSAGTGLSLYFERGKVVIPDQIKSDWYWFREPEVSRSKPFYITHRDDPVEAPSSYSLNLIDLMTSGILSFVEGKESPGIRDGYNALRCIALAMASHSERRPVGWEETNLIQDQKFNFT